MLFEYFGDQENKPHFEAVGRAAKVSQSLVKMVWESFQNLEGPEQLFSFFR